MMRVSINISGWRLLKNKCHLIGGHRSHDLQEIPVRLGGDLMFYSATSSGFMLV